jgi:hypothetical protein
MFVPLHSLKQKNLRFHPLLSPSASKQFTHVSSNTISPTTLCVSSNIPNDLPLVPLAVLASIILLITAQSWINFLLKGDRGLGAFLSDGSGYNKSGFKPKAKNDGKEQTEDPLPWLTLPQFDYVDVAGQPKRLQNMNEQAIQANARVVSKMEEPKDQIRIKIEEGDLETAKQIERELEALMKQEGYEFFKSFE